MIIRYLEVYMGCGLRIVSGFGVPLRGNMGFYDRLPLRM